MRRGFLLSLLLHICLVLALWFNLPMRIMPEEEVTFVNVKLVSSPDAATTTKEQEVKPTPTQQSAAPRQAPQKKKEQVKAPERNTQVVQSNKSKKKEQVKERKKQPAKQEKQEKTTDIRPPKLDKTRNKKSVVKSKNKPSPEKKEEDFLKALSFIDELKDKKSAQQVSEHESETAIYSPDQQEIAVLKKHIEQNWYRPPGIKGLDDLSVIVLVSLNRDGSVTNMELTRSSGEAFFDNSLLRAVRKSVPLPIPAEKYDLYKKIELRFNG